MWEYQVPFFVERGYRCVLPDRRGHGLSDRPSTGYDLDTRADDVAELVERLDLRDLTLVAHSARRRGGRPVPGPARHRAGGTYRAVRHHAAVPAADRGQPRGPSGRAEPRVGRPVARRPAQVVRRSRPGILRHPPRQRRVPRADRPRDPPLPVGLTVVHHRGLGVDLRLRPPRNPAKSAGSRAGRARRAGSVHSDRRQQQAHRETHPGLRLQAVPDRRARAVRHPRRRAQPGPARLHEVLTLTRRRRR
ncbi:alpha/beta fold hydrolase [Nocardia asiatica]|uniref:alpha/beta fold hydrolase n=1 Tax=Nocardia asiatica TaxID=209252 RepID=UPI003EE10459